MTQETNYYKAIEEDALFKTLRGLHPSDSQLRDIEVVEKAARDGRLKIQLPTFSSRKAAKKAAAGGPYNQG